MTDVFTSDMSTIAMESVTPNLDDYWCCVDEYMESGNINDLYCLLVNMDDSFRSLTNTNNLSVTIANDNDLGVLHNHGHLSIGRDGVIDPNIHTISVHESLASIQFTIEEHLLIHLSQACNDANAPLYLVDVIMDIIQDECEDSESMKHLHF